MTLAKNESQFIGTKFEASVELSQGAMRRGLFAQQISARFTSEIRVSLNLPQAFFEKEGKRLMPPSLLSGCSFLRKQSWL